MVKCGVCKYYQFESDGNPWRGVCTIKMPPIIDTDPTSNAPFTRADNGCDLGVDVINAYKEQQ